MRRAQRAPCTLTAERRRGEARNALLRREVGEFGSSRHQRDRLVEPVHLAPFPTPDAIGKVALAHVRASADRERAAAMEVYGLGKKYDLRLDHVLRAHTTTWHERGAQVKSAHTARTRFGWSLRFITCTLASITTANSVSAAPLGLQPAAPHATNSARTCLPGAIARRAREAPLSRSCAWMTTTDRVRSGGLAGRTLLHAEGGNERCAAACATHSMADTVQRLETTHLSGRRCLGTSFSCTTDEPRPSGAAAARRPRSGRATMTRKTLLPQHDDTQRAVRSVLEAARFEY